MIIANPLYDVVFKYLMEDIDIAREILDAVKINREYYDVLAEKKIENIKEDFVELLTHDSFIIQVRGLPEETKTKLERVLQVFNPKFKTLDKHRLDFTGKADEPIVQKMVARLQRAISDDEMRHKMDVEDEIDRILERENKKAADEATAKSAAEIAAQKVIIAHKDQIIAGKDEALEVEKQKLEEERLKTANTNELIVRNLILNTDLSDTQIATLTTFELDFVQQCRDSLNTD